MYAKLLYLHREKSQRHGFRDLIAARSLGTAMNPACATCAYLSTALLNLMEEHLKTECELYTAAFVLKDTRLAHQFNLRAAELLQCNTHLREEFKLHVEAEHGSGGELEGITQAI